MKIDKYITLGNEAFQNADWTTAIKHFKRVLKYDKNNPKAHNNLGIAYYTINEVELSLDHYAKALAVSDDPDYSIRYNKALTLLKKGEWDDGFDLLRYRWLGPANVAAGIFHKKYVPPEKRAHLWDGEDLNGKTILLVEEGGFGDIIQFLRYADCFEEGRVIVGLPDALVPLYPQYEQYTGQAYDYHCPLMNLPTIFTDVIPPVNKLTFAGDHKLKSPKKHNVGIVWRSRENKNMFFAMRNMHHNDTIPLLDIRDTQFHCLQIGLSDEEKEFVSKYNISTYEDEFKNWNDTAVIMDQLDCIISIDTAVGHLSGTMGKKTLMVIPFTAEWRWLTETEKSPWYPSVEICRAEPNWDSAINKVKRKLECLFSIPSLVI